MFDVGLSKITEDLPLKIQHGSSCLQQPYSSTSPANLIRDLCTGKNNQKFVWHTEASWTFHHILSHIDGTCVGASFGEIGPTRSGSDVGRSVTFRPCAASDPLTRWEFLYGRGQLRLIDGRGLCMNFDAESAIFKVTSCRVVKHQDDGGLSTWVVHSQVFNFDGVLPDTKELEVEDGLQAKFGIPTSGHFRIWSASLSLVHLPISLFASVLIFGACAALIVHSAFWPTGVARNRQYRALATEHQDLE